MRRTFTHDTKVRLSFSDRPNAPVNIADSMENAGSCSWIQRGDGSQVMKNFKDLQKLGVQSIEEYREASMPFPAFFPLTLLPYYPPCLQEHVACQRSLASLWCHVHTFCTWLWNSLIVKSEKNAIHFPWLLLSSSVMYFCYLSTNADLC